MRVVQVNRAFGLENLETTSRSLPIVDHKSVLIEMSTASLNSRDYLTVTGVYNPQQVLPLVPCSDGVGRVVEIGSEVSEFAIGDRVMPCFAQGWLDGPISNRFRRITLGGPLDGTLSEFMAVPENGLVAAPDYLTDAEASTLPCAALTAWNAVVRQASIAAGDTVVVEGTGGVAIFALQFAVMLGAKAIVLSKSDEKLERALSLGAFSTINYREQPEWSAIVKDQTDGHGADLVVDLGGKATVTQAVRAVRASGQVSLIGVLGGPIAPINLPLVVMRNVRLQGVTVGSRADFQSMLVDMEKTSIRPVVDQVFDMASVVSAFEYMASGAHFGKVCVSLGGDGR